MAADSAASVLFAVTHVDREVEYRDAAGNPLVDALVRYVDGAATIRTHRTDEHGRLRLSLPPVLVRFVLVDPLTSHRGVLWRAGRRPLVVTFEARR